MIDEATSPVGSRVEVTLGYASGDFGTIIKYHQFFTVVRVKLDSGTMMDYLCSQLTHVPYLSPSSGQTATGRLSSSDPNLQTFPPDTPEPVTDPLIPTIRCECGASKCGSKVHSSWCPLAVYT